MKKWFVFMALIAIIRASYAQNGGLSVVGNVGYQTDYERFALGVQGRYNLANHVRIAPDVTLFFPKDKVTGLDVNLNLHYVFDLQQDKLSFYPLAGFGMQNNHYGEQTITVDGREQKTDSHSNTDLAFNLGAGISYNLSAKTYLNAEGKFMFGDNDCAVILIGYGYKF